MCIVGCLAIIGNIPKKQMKPLRSSFLILRLFLDLSYTHHRVGYCISDNGFVYLNQCIVLFFELVNSFQCLFKLAKFQICVLDLSLSI